MDQQLSLLPDAPAVRPRVPLEPFELLSYDRYLVLFSGGKDSVASLLHLLDLGVPREKIELRHHLVDGKESDLFDWPCTDEYVKALARELEVPVYFSWREGGLEEEMLKENALSKHVFFETPTGTVRVGGGGKPATRLRYPQVAASLIARWCSAIGKVDVGRLIFTNDPRFENARTLVISGERAEESSNRANYAVFEPDDRDLRAPKSPGKAPRHIDRFRPVHGWSEREVWDILRAWGIQPHPAYMLGFSRCSCMTCVFLNDEDWARLYAIAPAHVERHIAYEDRFGKTIDRKREGLTARIARHAPPTDLDPQWVRAALSRDWTLPIRIPTDEWVMPLGAFRHSGGPT